MGNKSSSEKSKSADGDGTKCERRKVPKLVQIQKRYEILFWLDFAYFVLIMMFILLIMFCTQYSRDKFGIYKRIGYAVSWSFMAIGILSLGITRIVFGLQQYFDLTPTGYMIAFLVLTIVYIIGCIGLIISICAPKPNENAIFKASFGNLSTTILEKWPQAPYIDSQSPESSTKIRIERQVPELEGDESIKSNIKYNYEIKQMAVQGILIGITLMTLFTLP